MEEELLINEMKNIEYNNLDWSCAKTIQCYDSRGQDQLTRM